MGTGAQPNLKGFRAGTPDPLDFRYHRPLGSASDTLKAGAAFTAISTPLTALTPIAGALFVRIRGKATAGGTLSFLYLRPASVRGTNTSTDAYSAAIDPPHADVVVVADTEFVVDIEPGGESDLLATFDGSASGAWDFLDVMQQ